MNGPNRRRVWLSGVLLLALGAQAAAQQQEVGTPAIPGWTFTPGVGVGAIFDSNVALADAPASARRTEGDQLFEIQPFGNLGFTSPRTTFAADYSGFIRRYVDVTQLNSFDQRLNVALRRAATRRFTFFFADSYADVPTTDEVELNGVPFSRTGTQTNTFSGGFTARLTKFTDLTTRYENTWVTFDRDDPLASNFLADGTVNGVDADLSHRLNERTAVGAEYAVRLADLNDGTRQLTFHDAGGTFRYTIGPNTTFSAAAGVSYVIDDLLDTNRTGPYFRLGLTHDIERATIGASFERTNVPSFGLGGSSENQELRGFVRMPVVSNRFYVQGSAAWRRSDPLVETELRLDTIWVRSTVGYAAARWLRVEGLYTFSRQDSIVTGGEIDRHRAGIQAVISQPMRIR